MVELLRAADGAVYMVQNGKAVHVARGPSADEVRNLATGVIVKIEAARWRKFRGWSL